jgi:hypothetical protein
MLATTFGIDSENGLIHNSSVNQPNNQFNQNLPELVLIEGIQQVARKRDESLSPSLFTFRSRLTAVHHH